MESKSKLVSVIVPTYNSAKHLEACLKSIKSQDYIHVELIVVDNNSTDNTKNIAKKYTDKVYNRGPERSAQRNYGVQMSKGDYVLFIDSDMELSSSVVSSCVEAMKPKNIKAVVIPEESFGEGFWAQCKKLERSFYIGVDWMEAARFFDRATFEEMNGYDEDNTGTEDYDLPQRIQHIYTRAVIARTDNFIFHNEQKLSLIKTCKKKYYYAQKLSKYKTELSNHSNFIKQANPIERYKLFFSQPKKLIKNPIHGFGLVVMKTSELVAGGSGYYSSKWKAKQHISQDR